ncbi:hypothetical protein [Yersinia frederiksenii]|nr:hypothetical protein [Yersinia frederiksenii]MDN0121247.1 hypothetical protein [Yersinia frederiksenii]
MDNKLSIPVKSGKIPRYNTDSRFPESRIAPDAMPEQGGLKVENSNYVSK